MLGMARSGHCHHRRNRAHRIDPLAPRCRQWVRRRGSRSCSFCPLDSFRKRCGPPARQSREAQPCDARSRDAGRNGGKTNHDERNEHERMAESHLPIVDSEEAVKVSTGPVSFRARAARLGSLIPVIALTALAMKGDEERIRAAGCGDHVAKPMRYQEFLTGGAPQLGSRPSN